MGTNNRHTLVLVQFTESQDSRTYLDYDSLQEALDGVCELFERNCKVLMPAQREYSYTGADLLQYVERINDLCLMIASPDLKTYIPHGKQWIKQQLCRRLEQQVINK